MSGLPALQAAARTPSQIPRRELTKLSCGVRQASRAVATAAFSKMYSPLLHRFSTMRPRSRAQRLRLALLVGVPSAVVLVSFVLLHVHSKAIEKKGVLAYEHRRLDMRIQELGIRATGASLGQLGQV